MRGISRREHAAIIENHIVRELKEKGTDAALMGYKEWYDLEVNEIKVEVKASELKAMTTYPYKKKKYKTYRTPTFKITLNNHKQLLEANGYYCFVLTFKDEPVLIKFCSAKSIGEEVLEKKEYSYNQIYPKSPFRHLNMPKLFYYESMMDLDAFIREVIHKYIPVTATEREDVTQLMSTIVRLKEKIGKEIPVKDIQEETKIDEKKLEKLLETLKKEGIIFEPRKGVIMLI